MDVSRVLCNCGSLHASSFDKSGPEAVSRFAKNGETRLTLRYEERPVGAEHYSGRASCRLVPASLYIFPVFAMSAWPWTCVFVSAF